MKTLSFVIVTAIASSVPAVGQQTARSALSALAKARGSVIASQAVTLVGDQGQDQPRSWRIITRDTAYAGRYLEYVVQNGRVVEEHPLSAAEAAEQRGVPLVRKRVRMDSNQVFATADAAAREALVGFDSLRYELRNREFSQEPIWCVRLNDQSGQSVGELVVAAESGAVLRRSWSDAGHSNQASPADHSHGPAARVGSAEPDSGGFKTQALNVWEKARDGFQTGREVVHTNFRKVTDNIRGVFDRLRHGGHESKSWEEGNYDAAQ